MTKVLVTGCAGFLGSFLVEALLNEDYYVVGIDNFFRGTPENMSSFINHRHFRFIKLDLAHAEIPHSLIKDVEIVIHYAAINGTRYFYEIPREVFEKNVQMTLNVLKSIERSSIVKKIIYASSSEVYGNALYYPTPETHPILIDVENPRSCYALSKVISEFRIIEFCKTYSIKYVILRIFNTYGERMDTSSYAQVIPEFIRKLLIEPVFQIIGEGQQTRSFCYVSDHVEFVLRVMKKVNNEILNVGNDEEIKIIDLARLMHEIVGRPFKPVFLPPRKGDVRRRVPDISRIKRLTGYSPKVPLIEGLKRCIRWYAKYKFRDKLIIPLNKLL